MRRSGRSPHGSSARASTASNSTVTPAGLIPERPGSFREFCKLLGKRQVTEFNYRYSDARIAHLFVGIEVHNRRETAQLLAELKHRRIEAQDLSDNEMAKLHVRQLVGGHAPEGHALGVDDVPGALDLADFR